jgi:hypothetical protein
MSDQEQPSKQTSSVPLKKETVRVTLKAADAPAAPKPASAPPAPAAPKPTLAGAPPAPSAPSVPKPPTIGAPPAPSAPKPATAPAPAPAPTIQLKTAGAPGAPGAPAPTIKLSTPGAAAAPGSPTVSLPKATVQLQPPTQPLVATAPAASQAGTIKFFKTDSDEEEPVLVKALSVVGFLAAAAVIALQLMTANLWLTGPDANGNPQEADWSKLL